MAYELSLMALLLLKNVNGVIFLSVSKNQNAQRIR